MPMPLIEYFHFVPALPLLGVIVLLAFGKRLPDAVAAWLATGLVGAAFVLSVGIGLDYRELMNHSGGTGSDAHAAASSEGTVYAADLLQEDASDADHSDDDAADGAHADEAGSDASDHSPDAADSDDLTKVKTLWRWMSVGDDLVGYTMARQDLPEFEEIPEGAVGLGWLDRSVIDGLDEEQLADFEASQAKMWDPAATVGLKPLKGTIKAGQPVTLDNLSQSSDQVAEEILATPGVERAFNLDLSLQLDGLSLVMMLIITGVGFLIHVYSVGYMAHDSDIRRYFTYLNLFVFSMLMLVMGGNFLVMFVGWELVGACSYLLIGFWYKDSANASAGRKAFIVNRIGDFAFLIGLMLIWSFFGTLDYAAVMPEADRVIKAGGMLAMAIPVMLLIGATGKSAQIPLFVWLPDAMAGPTPVSALIHAATMVTAGIYMIARSSAIFDAVPEVMAVVATVGALTALMAALIAVVQVDIKRVLAYSTISQLGYMFLAVGAGAYIAGVFHLMTHAFFKALLFLGAGSVMHAVEHGFHHASEHPDESDDAMPAHPEALDGIPPEQDMRYMGGLLKKAPLTGWTFIIGGLALAGLFPLAGFWSKDEILLGALEGGNGEIWLMLWPTLYGIGLLTAFITAFYTGRQLLMVFLGAPRSSGAKHAHESPAVMTMPLVVLAILTLVGGFLNAPIYDGDPPLARLLSGVLHVHHPEHALLPFMLIATATSLVGLLLAWLTYGPNRRIDPARMAERMPWAYNLAWNKFYVDEIYDKLFVSPFRRIADFLWQVVDVRGVDAAVNATGRRIVGLGQGLRSWQAGYLRRYALSMLAGAVLMAGYFLWWLR